MDKIAYMTGYMEKEAFWKELGDWAGRTWDSTKKAGFDPSVLWDTDTYKGVAMNPGAFVKDVVTGDSLGKSITKTIDDAVQNAYDVGTDSYMQDLKKSAPYILGGLAAAGGGWYLYDYLKKKRAKQAKAALKQGQMGKKAFLFGSEPNPYEYAKKRSLAIDENTYKNIQKKNNLDDEMMNLIWDELRSRSYVKPDAKQQRAELQNIIKAHKSNE